VHRATVYRTLDGLTAAGLLCHVHLDRGLTAYHLANSAKGDQGAPHLHAQCSECGRIVDLPPHVLGDTAARIQRARGFRLDPTHVALSGLCQACATRVGARADPGHHGG
jgi:Fur family ferric uptake transcriptional regulator